MPEPQYEIRGRHVIRFVADHASEDTKRAFFELLDKLRRDPRDPNVGVRPYTVAVAGIQRGGMFTAPFGDGLLLYQVIAGYPRIYLYQVVLIGP